MIPKIKVEFRIIGLQISPEEITDFLHLKPSRTWKIGDSIENTKMKRKQNGWCLSLNDSETSLNVEDYICPILKILIPKSKSIKRACKDYQLESEINCVIYITDEAPIINLSKQVIAELTDLETSVDIDLILTR